MHLWAHHFVELEIMGRRMPVGAAEHAVAFAAAGVAFLLMAYGAYAGLRDLLRWRRRVQSRVAGHQ
ncbi:MAG TPA: hypothetical protein VG013_30735 [Gemmataceae bacterium]|jgi:hypothetical protein|nr:hypothetical protein [Gemmataceae bacterium]